MTDESPAGAASSPKAEAARFPCAQCGADLSFRPGTTHLQCAYCGHVNEIEPVATPSIEERDYRAALDALAAHAETLEVDTVRCDACGSEAEPPPDLDAFDCAFCGKAIISPAARTRLLRPQGVLPFHVDRQNALERFRVWLRGLWFAPNDLRQFARSGGRLRGVYLPYWTYDCRTETAYTGQRGEHYWVPETYTTTVNGKTVTRTRMVRKTRWYPAAGRVHNRFDDLLIAASQSLPRDDLRALEPWDLESVAAFTPEYLAGFQAEKYQVELDEGFRLAGERMEGPIRATIRRDIGGDEQRIFTVHTQPFDITFKHLLLPVWVSAYTYRDTVYRVLINARTGEVRGDRPYSVWKIIGAVLLALLAAAVIGGLAFLFAE